MSASAIVVVGSLTLVTPAYAVDGPPAITSISPNQGPVTGGTEVTITGEHFRDTRNCGGTPDVYFGTTLVDGPYGETDTTFVVTAPAHDAETVHVTIDFGECETAPTSADLYTYGDPEPTPPGCTITGTPNNDTLNGTNGADVICGLGGNDTINGGNGDDTIYAGSGDDGVAGGNGADTIYGGPGNDTTNGETLLGSLLSFDNGNDTINGGPGNDTLDGQNGNDTLSDTDPSDTDTMSGNVGTDTINVQDNDGNDTANGGLGSDTCTVDAGDTTSSC